MKMLRRTILFVVPVLLGLLGMMIVEAGAAPVERHIALAIPTWPAGATPIRIALFSDTHTSWPGDTPARLRDTIARIAAAKPDIALFAGDLLSNDTLAYGYDAEASAAPLAGLRPPLGAFAVLGNHDYKHPEAVTHALEGVGFRVLTNAAARAGPIALLGVGDALTGHDDAPRTVAAGLALGGVPLMLTHNPLPIYHLSDAVPLALAGHTHCDQVLLPLIGPIVTEAQDRRYACGVVREARRIAIITGGLGVSKLPIRLNSPPDYWIIDIGGPRPGALSTTR